MTSVLRFNQWQRSDGTNMGTVLQVIQTVKRDTWSSSSDSVSFYPVTGMTATITPRFSTSKVLGGVY
jgi:hypothetical protein